MNYSWALLFLIGLSAIGCTKHPSYEPTPAPDWSADVAGSCDRAFEVLSANGCPEATPKGTTWADFCARAQASNGAIDLRVGCISRAGDLEAVRACKVRCKQ